MFFFLSKTLNYLMMPLTIVSILFIVSALLKNREWRRRFFFSALTLFLFWSNEFIANEIMTIWEIAPTPYERIAKKYQWGIVLTGVTKGQMEITDRVYFQKGADRVTHTLQLYKMGVIKKILISGGSGRLIDIGQREARELQKVFILMGVNEEDILVEDSSRNTHESAVEVSKILEKITTPENCLLITSGFHMRRSRACFAKEGWMVDTFSADFLTHKRTFNFDALFIPKIDGFIIWNHIMKENLGYLSYKIAGYI